MGRGSHGAVPPHGVPEMSRHEGQRPVLQRGGDGTAKSGRLPIEGRLLLEEAVDLEPIGASAVSGKRKKCLAGTSFAPSGFTSRQITSYLSTYLKIYTHQHHFFYIHAFLYSLFVALSISSRPFSLLPRPTLGHANHNALAESAGLARRSVLLVDDALAAVLALVHLR